MNRSLFTRSGESLLRAWVWVAFIAEKARSEGAELARVLRIRIAREASTRSSSIYVYQNSITSSLYSQRGSVSLNAPVRL